MKEVLKVRIANTTLSLSTEAHNLLDGYLGVIEAYSGKEAAEEREALFVEQILARQTATTVVEESVVEEFINTVGYPEGCAPAARKAKREEQPQTTTPTPSNNTPNDNTTALGRVFKTCLLIVGWVVGISWLLAAMGLLIAFIVLLAIGEFDSMWLTGYEGLSPVVFCGLICAVVVLFMGIVADVWFKLLMRKRINPKGLIAAVIIWFVFFGWLCIASVRNADNWLDWSQKAVERVEVWEKQGQIWEEKLDADIESLFENEGVLEWTKSMSYTLKGGLAVDNFDSLCERFELLESIEDVVGWELVRNRDVAVAIDFCFTGGEMVRHITVTTQKEVYTFSEKLCGESWFPCSSDNREGCFTE